MTNDMFRGMMWYIGQAFRQFILGGVVMLLVIQMVVNGCMMYAKKCSHRVDKKILYELELVEFKIVDHIFIG